MFYHFCPSSASKISNNFCLKRLMDEKEKFQFLTNSTVLLNGLFNLQNISFYALFMLNHESLALHFDGILFNCRAT